MFLFTVIKTVGRLLYSVCLDFIKMFILCTGKGSEEFGLKHSQVHAGTSSGKDMAPISCL